MITLHNIIIAYWFLILGSAIALSIKIVSLYLECRSLISELHDIHDQDYELVENV